MQNHITYFDTNRIEDHPRIEELIKVAKMKEE
jgi:hypothetical protein